MLSKDLTFLHHWWDEVLSGGLEFTPAGAFEFRDRLRKAAIDAQALEILIETAAGICNFPAPSSGDNVVRFPGQAKPRRPDDLGGAA